MTRRGKVALLLAVFSTYACGLWLALRRPIPIEFTGPDRPQFDFVFSADIGRNPIVNFDFPLLGRVTYPSLHVMAEEDFDPSRYPGMIDLGSSPQVDPDVSLIVGRKEVSLEPYSLFTESRPTKALPPLTMGKGPWGADSITYHRIFALPYAIDPTYRDTSLKVGDRQYSLRLPTTSKFGSSIRRTEVMKVGSWTVTAKPRPWILSLSPVVFDLTSDVSDGRRLIFRPRLKEAGWVYPDRQLSIIGEAWHANFVVAPNEGRTLILDAEELVPLPSKLRLAARKHNDRIALFTAGGDLIWANGLGVRLERHGLRMIEWMGRAYLTGVGKAIDRNRPIPTLREGDSVEVTAYRTARHWSATAILDVPKGTPLSSYKKGEGIMLMPK